MGKKGGKERRQTDIPKTDSNNNKTNSSSPLVPWLSYAPPPLFPPFFVCVRGVKATERERAKETEEEERKETHGNTRTHA